MQMKTLQTMSLVSIIAITLACGYSSKSTPAVAGTIPSITQLNPNAATAGGAAFVLTVNGTNFGTKAVVNWNGAAQTTTYVSGTQLTASVPATMIAASGTVQITVTNPATGGNGIYGGGTMAETSGAMDFTIN
jgi:hypothetical protein